MCVCVYVCMCVCCVCVCVRAHKVLPFVLGFHTAYNTNVECPLHVRGKVG